MKVFGVIELLLIVYIRILEEVKSPRVEHLLRDCHGRLY
jgi:hypothetical protein